MQFMVSYWVQVPNRLNLESESSFESAQGLTTDSEKWKEEITASCEQWKDFRGRLKEFCNCCGELYDRLIIGIDSRPIGVFVEDLDAFGKQLEVCVCGGGGIWMHLENNLRCGCRCVDVWV